MLEGLLGVREFNGKVVLRFDCLEAAREFGRDFADNFVRKYGEAEAVKFPLTGPEKRVLDYRDEVFGVIELEKEFWMSVPGDEYHEIEDYLKSEDVT